MDDVVHLINFQSMSNRTEVPTLMQACLNGAKQEGYDGNFVFQNYK